MQAFESLYNRNMLARFVIDEAHCVSQVSIKIDEKKFIFLDKIINSQDFFSGDTIFDPIT